MKIVLILLLIVVSSFKVSATHNIGGHITYTALDTFIYAIKLTTYTDARSIEADRPVITINFDDGKSGDVNRTSQRLVSENIYENIYNTQHDYSKSGTGNYLVSFFDNNRIKDIKNAENSVSEPFYLESLLVIDLKECANSSPDFTIPPVFYASIKNNVIQSMNIFDIDGDSLVYELIKPLKDSAKEINGYIFPKGLKVNGKQLIWHPENLSGKYLITIKISEYRFGKLMGYVVKEWLTDLVPSDSSLTIQSACNLPDSIVCVYNSRNGNSVMFEIKVPGITLANGKLEMFAPVINFSGPQPDFKVTEDTSGNLTGKFTWQPEEQNSREQLYNFVFRASKNGNPAIQNQKLVNMYVDGADPEPCKTASIGLPESALTEMPNIFPNPFSHTAIIKFNGFMPGRTCIIYNLQGQKVAEIAAHDPLTLIDGNKRVAGMYIFHICTVQKMLSTGKFVIQK